MQIAKIVASKSHVEYVARVLDNFDVSAPPRPDDYGFGRFAAVECEERKFVGVVSNTQLVNPYYGDFGPRLSSPPETNRLFSPDYLHDQGTLIELTMLGRFEGGCGVHEPPNLVLPIHAPVLLLDDDHTRAFHLESGRLRMLYYGQILSLKGRAAPTLIMAVIDRLMMLADASESEPLKRLRQQLHIRRMLPEFD